MSSILLVEGEADRSFFENLLKKNTINADVKFPKHLYPNIGNGKN